MPKWLDDAFKRDHHIPLLDLAIQLTIAFTLGCIVAGVYRFTQGKKRSQSAGLLATLVLLTVLITMVTVVIGDNVARAFSLVGALAIVRFRTVVEDTRDTAFVIFAVAEGVALGAGYLMVSVVTIPFAASAAFLFRPRDPDPVPTDPLDFSLIIRIGVGHNPDVVLRAPFERHVEKVRLLTTSTARQGAAIDLTYGIRLRREEGALALVADLNGVEGVQNVELRRT